jgi:hypothetical protein
VPSGRTNRKWALAIRPVSPSASPNTVLSKSIFEFGYRYTTGIRCLTVRSIAEPGANAVDLQLRESSTCFLSWADPLCWPYRAVRAAAPSPCGDQIASGFTHCHGHFDRALGEVGDRHRIVKEHHDPIARELIEHAFKLADERSQRAMIFAQKVEDFFRFRRLGKGGVAAQVAEDDDNLAAMAFEGILLLR